MAHATKAAPEKAPAPVKRETAVARPRATTTWPPTVEGAETLLTQLSDTIDHVFAELGLRRGMPFARLRRAMLPEMMLAQWAPRIETLERDGKFVVRAELPGISKENVKIEAVEGRLVLSGERTEETEERKEGYFHTERHYGSFYRAIPLPEGAKPEGAKATFKDGVLEVAIEVPPVETPTATKIEIADPAK